MYIHLERIPPVELMNTSFISHIYLFFPLVRTCALMHSCPFLTSLCKDTHIHVHRPRHTQPQMCPSALIGPCTPTRLHGGAQAPPHVCAPVSRYQTLWGRDRGDARRGREEAEAPEAGGGGTVFWSSKSP